MLVANYEVVVFAEDGARLNAHHCAGEYVLLIDAHVAVAKAIRDAEVSSVKIVKIPRVVG